VLRPSRSVTGHELIGFGLLWLAGLSLRITVLAVPPVIHLIRTGWRLSGTEVGLLVTLPTALFAAIALPGAALVGRIGPVPTLVAGLVVTGAGAAARAIAPGIFSLLVTTAVMGAGVAVLQPTLPALVRRWSPARIGLGTAVYSNGLLVGEILPVALTAPVVLPAVGGSWSLSLAAWAIPVVGTAVLVVLAAPAVDRAPHTQPSAAVRAPPQWRSPLTWLLGALFGSINVTYFATNAFLPAHLTARHEAALIPLALTALNAGQLPAAFLMLARAGRWQQRARPFMVTGLICLASIVGVVVSPGAGVVAWAALLGFGVSAAMVLALTLPALLHPPEQVAATSAVMFTISYTGAILAAMAGGAAWDATGDPRWAFTPVAVSASALGLLAIVLRRRRALR
jgi:CP family cyanate transporter-like MFS transporter